MTLKDELTPEEYAEYQRTTRLPARIEQRTRSDHKSRLLELARWRAARGGMDPTLRDNVHVSHPVHTPTCDMDEDCCCPATDEQIDRSFDAYR